MGLLLIFLSVEYHNSFDTCMNGFYLLMHMYIIYVVSFLLFIICNKTIKLFAIISVSLICLKESYTGIMQLLGYKSSNHLLYAITGNFQNPGPFGGFVAVCVSLLIAYCVKESLIYKRSNVTKLLFWFSLITAVIGIIILPSTHSRSAVLSLGCSLILLSFGTEHIRNSILPVFKKYSILILCGVTILGVGAYFLKKPSADGRLFMDGISFNTICMNGWRGAGAGKFGAAYAQTQSQYFKNKIDKEGIDDLDWSVINEHDRLTADCPSNSFNEYLFFGVEEGPVFMILMLTLIIVAISVSFKKNTIWCYGLVTLSVFSFFSYPFHIRQFQILTMILIAACISDGRQERNKGVLIELVSMSIALGFVVTILIIDLPVICQYGEVKKSWVSTQKWHVHEQYEYATEDCAKLFPFLQNDIKFLFAYGQSLNKIGEYEKSDSILRMGTEISSDPMFWNVMGNNSLALGRYREAEERYKHAFYIVPNRLYPLNLLAKLYYTEGDTARFLDMADRVETFIPKVESASTAQLREEIRQLKAVIILKQEQ